MVSRAGLPGVEAVDIRRRLAAVPRARIEVGAEVGERVEAIPGRGEQHGVGALGQLAAAHAAAAIKVFAHHAGAQQAFRGIIIERHPRVVEEEGEAVPVACQTVERVAGGAEPRGIPPLGVPDVSDLFHVVAERLVRLAEGLRAGLGVLSLLGEVVELADALHPGAGPRAEERGIALGQVGEVPPDVRPAIRARQAVKPLITLPAVATEDAGRVGGVVIVQTEHAAGDGAGAGAMLARRVLVTGIPYHAHIEYYEHLGSAETSEKNTRAK